MKQIYTWDAQPARRNLTVADLRAGKGLQKRTQTTANTAEEAAAAADAGIDLIMGNAQNTTVVRQGAPHLFFTAAIGLPDYPGERDVLKAAFEALKQGADAIYTARSLHIVEMLAREDIPVMGHLGLIPRKSTWRGGLRAIGRDSGEALELSHDFRRLEEAGAFAVESEVICAPVMEEITRSSGLVTVSLGSGSGADVIYLFQNDICGEQVKGPRHARAFGNLRKLQDQIAEERRAALTAFRTAALSGDYPQPRESVTMDQEQLRFFKDALPGTGTGS